MANSSSNPTDSCRNIPARTADDMCVCVWMLCLFPPQEMGRAKREKNGKERTNRSPHCTGCEETGPSSSPTNHAHALLFFPFLHLFEISLFLKFANLYTHAYTYLPTNLRATGFREDKTTKNPPEMTNESRSLGSTCVKEFLLHRSLIFFVPTISPHTFPLQMSDFLLVKKGEKSGKFATTSPAATSEPRIIGVEHIPYGHAEQTFSSHPLIRTGTAL